MKPGRSTIMEYLENLEANIALVIEVQDANIDVYETNRDMYGLPEAWYSSGVDDDVDGPSSRECTPLISAAQQRRRFLYLPWTTAYQRSGYTFGRSRSNHVILPNIRTPAMSLQHFRILRTHEDIWILEAYSKNGTIFHGKVEAGEIRALHPQKPNIIRVGDTTLTIHVPVHPDGLTEDHRSQRSRSIRSMRSADSQSSLFRILDYKPRDPQKPRNTLASYHVHEKARNEDKTHFNAVGIYDGLPYILKYMPEGKSTDIGLVNRHLRQYSRITASTKVCV
jgi:hypothetical protein